ncbi:MAG TPA: HEAT repeat domain-containing protein [Kofleriaceae bacterium]|nr:HEAT repeat domain-containing protein [Kofleriaceae bacterium]
MAKKSTGSSGSARLGASVVKLLEHEKLELRSAAATVLAAVGRGDEEVVAALAERLGDPEVSVRRIALEGLAGMGATGIAPRLIPLLRGDDEALAERAAQVLATQGAAAESALRKELPVGAVPVRRAMAQLLIERGTASAIEAVLDQLGDAELGEQVLQLLRAEIDRHNEKAIAVIDRSALARTSAIGKKLKTEWNRVVSQARKKDGKKDGKKKNGKSAPPPPAETAGPPAMDPAIAAAAFELGLLLRLIGYRAQPASLPLLISHVSEDLPRSIRLAAIAAMRRVVAASEARGTDKAIEMLIALAGGSDLVVAQAAIDTLAGARVPERLARSFAALVKSKNPAAQKLAMSRLPAGGGAAALKALVDALAGADLAARDAAARGLARAPEAVLPLARALCAATDVEVARRYAALIRQHRAHVSSAAADEMAEAATRHLDTRGKAADEAHLLARVLLETLAQVAPHQHVQVLFNHARKLRRAGKPVEAFGALRPLLHSPTDLDAAIDDDQRFILAVLGLEAIGQGILRATGADAPVLEQFARLYQRGYPVARKLAREKDVGDEAVYALGFRLLESQTGIDQEFGAELMQGIIDERPRSKLARNARNKLKLAGYLDA